MKTPFDGAIRIRQREIDELRIAISIEVDRVVQIEAAQADASAAMRAEHAVAADAALVSSYAYLQQMQRERVRLAKDRALVEARLAQLRDHAASAYGATRAIETAADQYRETTLRAIASAEQGELDDIAAANLHRGAAR
jgi:hypothetical protein